MLQEQEKTYPPIFRCAGNMATTQDSAEEKLPEKKEPEILYIFSGMVLTKKEMQEWDNQ